MADLDAIAGAARALLEPFLVEDPAARRDRVAALEPDAGDFALAFRADVVERARAAYAALWAARPSFGPRAGQLELQVHAALADDFQGRAPRAWAFPGGYGRVAPLLRAGVPWVCWRFVAPGERLGLAYDGLAWLGRRWAWFPKPWRALVGRAALPVKHWLE